jgi:putative SbcD/Mre11-related phosphoesterase
MALSSFSVQNPFLFTRMATSTMSIKFITNEPAVQLPGRILVIADLHIGAEYEFRRAGIKIPSQTKKLLERTKKLIKQTKSGKVIILGDIKHKVPGLSFQEERELPVFLNTLIKDLGIEVEIVPGNHDDGLQSLVPDVKFHPSLGILLGDVYLTHGHTWPSPDFLKASHVLSGHRHPVIEFRDKLGYVWRERVWMRASLKKEAIKKKYSKKSKTDKIPTKLPEFIAMPAFNDMVGGTALNTKRLSKTYSQLKRKLTPLGPLLKSVQKRTARVYLLDGTYLGELGKLDM